MNHSDHVALLRDGVPARGGVWADFGSGGGAFTLALADLIGAGGLIYSIDKDRSALSSQEREMRAQFPDVTVLYLVADFTKPLDLPLLDGAVMANSLHFVREKDAVIQRIKSYLRPGGKLLMVEYNTDRGNTWVPYPFSYPTWEKMATRNGFTKTRLLSHYPSRFLNEIYSAVSEVE